MTQMKKLSMVLLAALLLGGAVQAAEEFPNEPYEFVLAKLAAAEGRWDEALTRVERVVEKNPNDPIVLFERAMMLLDASRVDRAENELRSIVARHPDFYDAQRMLGRLLLDRAGNDRAKAEKALEHLQAAYRINPDDLASGMTVSQLLVTLGKTEEAERILATLSERAPDQRSIAYAYAQVLTKLGRGDESKKHLERAVALDATFGPAILQLLEIYQQEQAWQKAAEILQPLVDEDPLNMELQRRQAFFFLRAGMTEKARAMFNALLAADPKDERSMFYLAEALSDLDEYVEAERLYRKLLADSPGDAELLANLGMALAGQQNWDEAAKTFTTVLSIPGTPENLTALARTQLGYIDLQRGNLDAAVETSKHIFIYREKPNHQAINIAVEALKRQKKYAEAVTLLQPLTARFESDDILTARYMEMLLRAGEKEKAQALAASQTKFGSRNTIAAAEAYIQAGDAKAAVALVREALKTKPNELDLQFELASAYERSGDHKAAEETFLAVLQKHPDHAASLNYLGYMWADANRNLERAQEMLVRAVSQEPRNGAYVDSLGWVYYRLGKLELAEKYLTDATRLLPRDATVHEHLGDVLAKRGEAARALESYRTALTLELEAKDEEKIRSKIAELERR